MNSSNLAQFRSAQFWKIASTAHCPIVQKFIGRCVTDFNIEDENDRRDGRPQVAMQH